MIRHEFLTGKNLTYLLGILNSTFFLFAFKNYYAGGHLGSKGIRFKSEFMKSYPIPPITEANQGLVAEIENKVDEIIAAKAADPDVDTSNLEKEIDRLVYGLYDLTDDEIAIVEGSVLNRGFAITRIFESVSSVSDWEKLTI